MLKNQKYIFIDLPGFTKNIVMHQNVNSNFIHHALRVKIIFYIIDIYNNDLINICKNFKKLLLIIQKTNVKLFLKDSWIIINKIDMVNLSYATIMCDKIVRDLKWKNPVFEISAINIIGINEVFDAISFYL